MNFKEPQITEFKIKCEICKKWFKKLTHAHLFKKHFLTIDEYKERFGYCRTQPLEAYYIKSIRQKYNKHNKAYKNLTKNYAFKKGHKRKDKRRWQELYRLKKYNERIKGKFLCITPAELVCVFDLYYKLKYPKERISKIMKLSINYIRNLLKRKDVYKNWRYFRGRKK